MKKIASLLLVAAMLITVFAGCSNTNVETDDTQGSASGQESNPQTSMPDDGEVDYVNAPDLSGMTIRIMTDESGWTTDGYASVLPKFKQIEELTGCTIVWETITSDYSTVLQTRLVGDPADCPDIVMLTNSKAPSNYIEDGFLAAISDYYDVAPNIEAWYDANPTLKGQFTYFDGSIYSLPNCAYTTLDDFNEIYAESGDHTFWYRADIAEELGFTEAPTTLEEYEALLMAVKEAYPDMHPLEVNGLSNAAWATLRNFTASFGMHFNFESTGSYYYPDENGDVQFEPATQACLDWLTTMNRWYEEGLVWDAGDWTPYYANPGTGLSFSGFWNGAYSMEEAAKETDEDAWFGYMSFVPANGYDVTYMTRSVTCWSTVVIDNGDEDRLEAAISFLDFAFYSDYGIYSNKAGVMGEGWDFGENGEFVPSSDYIKELINGYVHRDSGADMWTRLCCLYDAEVTSIWNEAVYAVYDELGISYGWQNQDSYESYMAANAYNFSHTCPAYPSFYCSEDDQEVMNEYSGDIGTFTSEYIAKAVLGEVDLANFQTEFVDVLYDQLGLQQVLDIQQQYYDAYVAAQG